MYIALTVIAAFVLILGNAWCNIHGKYPEKWFYPIHWTVTGAAVVAMFCATFLR